MRINYFAYGSNMSSRRLQNRIPAEKLGTAVLPGYTLCFTKPSEADGSAKCDICPSTPGDSVIGVVYSIEESDKPVLDEFEGLGYGYRATVVTVTMNGRQLKVFTYMALNSREDLKPFCWYRQHVLEGAIENALPPEYVNRIRETPAIADRDRERQARELAIYS